MKIITFARFQRVVILSGGLLHNDGISRQILGPLQQTLQKAFIHISKGFLEWEERDRS